MSKIIIAGTTITVKSNIKMDDMKKIAAYRPNALKLFDTDEDGHKIPVFSVGVTRPGMGCISDFGVCFGNTTFDDDKTCCVTIGIPEGTEDVRKFVSEKIGMSIVMLDKVEAQITPALEEIAIDEATVAEHIVIC